MSESRFNPDRRDLNRDVQEVLAVLEKGGLALLPLNVAYGFATYTEEGLKRVMEMKKRPSGRPCVVLGSPRVFEALADSLLDVRQIQSPVGLVVKLKESEQAKQLPSIAVS